MDNLINRNITPDPFNPHRGDVYEHDALTSGGNHITVGSGGGCKHTFNVSGTVRTRIVVREVTSAAGDSEEMVWCEVNGAQKRYACADFPIVIASLSGLAAIGRVRSAAVTSTAESAPSEQGIRTGSSVRIARKVVLFRDGTDTCWVPEMDDLVGKVGVVSDVRESDVVVDTGNNLWSFAPEALDLVPSGST
jgi:hypothetical protein